MFMIISKLLRGYRYKFTYSTQNFPLQAVMSLEDRWDIINDFEALEERFKGLLTSVQERRALEDSITQLQNYQVSKNSEISKKLREFGNWQYVKCDDPDYFNSAIESFTKSIAFAPLGSTELSLAYANRSALLMKARLYDDALMDIKRALKTGYPDRLKAKLFLRRALCLKAVDPTAESDIEKALENARGWLRRMDKKSPSRQIVTDTLNDLNKMAVLPPPRTKWNAKKFLSGLFEENPEIIDASSSITIKPMENNKFGIIATKDIKPGEIISTQEPYATLLHTERRYTNCWHCRNRTSSAIPCNFCVHSVFCSETCRDAAWSEYHNIECQIPPSNSVVESKIAPYQAVIMRMMIRAVKEAGSLPRLKEIIKRIESDPDLKRKGFAGSKFDGSKLSSIYGLLTQIDTPNQNFRELFFQSFLAAFILAILSNFYGEKMTPQRFYRHELVPFVSAVLMRFLVISIGTLQEGYESMDSSTAIGISLMFVPLHSYMAHSCAPNVSRCVFGSKVVMYAQYPIKQNEQIFQCRGLTFERNSKKDRQAEITRLFGYPCCCVACTENWPDTDLPLCNVYRVSGDLLLAHKKLLETIEKRLELSMRGHFAVIAKLINDLSMTISDWWDWARPPSRELAQAVGLLNRVFLVLSNRQEFL